MVTGYTSAEVQANIRLDTSRFKTGIEECVAQLKSLNKEFEQAVTSFNITTMEKQFKQLQTVIDKAKQDVASLSDTTKSEMTAAFKEVGLQATQSLNQVSEKSVVTKNEIATLSTELKSLAATNGFGLVINQMSQAQMEAIKLKTEFTSMNTTIGAISSNGKIKLISSDLSQVNAKVLDTGHSVSGLGSIFTQLVQSFGTGASRIGELSTEIANVGTRFNEAGTTIKRTSLSGEQFAATVIGSLRNTGISVDELGTRFKSLGTVINATGIEGKGGLVNLTAALHAMTGSLSTTRTEVQSLTQGMRSGFDAVATSASRLGEQGKLSSDELIAGYRGVQNELNLLAQRETEVANKASFAKAKEEATSYGAKIQEVTGLHSELSASGQAMSINLTADLNRVMMGWNEINGVMKKTQLTQEQVITMGKAGLGTYAAEVQAFATKSGMSMNQYVAKLNQAYIAETRMGSGATQLASKSAAVGTSMETAGNKMASTKRRVNELDTAFGLLRRTLSLLVVMIGFELVMRLGQASAATINARANVKSMASILGWSSQEVQKFTNKGKELQSTYAKIDMSQVESQVMTIAQQYKLSSSAATEFIDTAAVFTASMKSEGRSTEDATLALKDLVDQGTAWSRRAQEIGVTEEKLKATHLWSGKADDTEGLIKALRQVQNEMGLTERAMRINTPAEAVNALEVAFANLAADIYEAFSPDITFIIGTVAKALLKLDQAVLSLQGAYNGLNGWWRNAISTGLKLGAGLLVLIYTVHKVAPAFQTAKVAIQGFYEVLKNREVIQTAIQKLLEYIGVRKKLEEVENTPDGTSGKTKKAPKMEENPYGDLPGKMETYNWKADLKFKMQKIGVNFLAAAVIIAAAMVLITEAILLLILPMTALAAAGMVYKSIEPQVKQGMEAISEMAPVILPLLVAVSALMLVFNKFSVTYTTVGKTALNVGTGIAAALLLVAEAIFMMIPSLLSLAAVGYVYGAVETAVDNGIKGINAVSKALTALAPFLLLFIAATLLVAIPIANVISIGAVAGGIAVGIGLLCEAILGMYPPLLSLAALGNNMPNMAAVNKGTKAIESVSKALQVLSVAMGYILIVDFEVMADAIAKIINAGLGVFDDIGTALDDIKHFITTMNSKSIPQLKGAEAKVKALSEATKILNRLKATLLSLSEATKAIGITNFETDKVVDAVTQIGKMMSGLNKLKITAPDFSGKIQAFNNLKKFFDAMAGAMKSMNQANADTGFNVDMSITTKVQALSNIMSQVNAMKIHAPNFTEKIRAMESLKSFMNSLSSLAKTISQAQANIAGGIDSAKITGAVTSITHIMSTINGMKITAPDFSGKVSALNSLTTFIVPLRSIVGYINNTNVGTDFYTKCTNIGNAMTWIAKLMSTLNKVQVTAPDFSAKITGMNNLKSLITSMRSVITSIKSMSTQFTNAGKGLGNNLATGLKSAKSNVGAAGKELVSQAISSIKNRYATFRSAGHAAGAAAATGLRSGISNMNVIMKTELSSTINEMKSRYSTFYSAGHALGAAAAQGFRDGNQMHSPGIIARSTKQEMDYTLNYLDEAVEPIKAKGTALGQTMATAFTQNSSLNAPSLNTGNIDPSQTASQMSQMMSTQQQYNTQMQQQAVQDSTLINGITANTALTTTGQFNQMSTTIGSSFQQLGLSTQTNLNGIANTNTTYLNKMNANTRTGMTKVQNTTKTNLHQMQSTTTSTVSKMNSAWNNMRGTIVSAAGQIRSQSYAKFSSLHRSISSFYNQLSSAHFTAGLATGPGGNLRGLRIGRRGPHTGGRIRTPSRLSSVTRRTSSSEPSYGTSDFDNRKKSKLYLELLDNPDPLLLEQLRLSSGDPDGYYGTVNSNYQRIKQTVDSYSIADPYFLGIQIPMDNHVGDWDDGRSKRIDASNFESILSLVLTTRGFRNPGSYSYYSDSMKSNQETWDSVSCNCYDGAEMIAEIGRMLVGNGSIVHGSWNGEGHMAAMVNGQIFDMTQFQKHGVFRGTTGVSFGPSPSNTSSVTRNYGRGTNSVTPHPAETTVININFDGATINGEADFAEKMEAIARKIFYKEQGVNPNTGI